MKLKYLLDLNNLKKRQVYILLAIIVILGSAIRYYPFLHKLMTDDPYYQYTIARSILEDGHVPERLPLASYPQGKDIRFAPLLLPYFIAHTYRIVQPLGISLMDYMIAFPAVFGALAAVPLYFLVERLFDKRVALVSALIYVILPASISRTYAGFVEKESLAAVLIFIWLYLFVRSSKELNIKDRKSLLLPILSGLFMGLSAMTWKGAAYFALLITLSVFIHTVKRPDKAIAYSIVIMTLVGFATMHLFRPLAFPLQSFLFNYQYAALTYVSILAVAAILPEHIERVLGKKTKPIHIIGLSFGLFVLSILVFNLQDKILSTIASMVSEISGGKTPALVKEAQRATYYRFTVSDNPFSWLILFIPVGLYYFLKDLKSIARFDRIFLLAWIISAAYAAYLQVRLFFILAPVASIFIAYSFLRLVDPLLNPVKLEDRLKIKKTGEEKASKAEKGPLLKSLKVAILITIIGLSVLGTVILDVQLAGSARKVNTQKVFYWEDAMAYVKDSTPEDSVIISLWDYGYMIQGLGERATIVDPGVGGKRRIDSAKIFTSPEDEALKIIQKYNPKDKPIYVLISLGEIFKQEGIRQTAQDDDLDIRILPNILKSADWKQDISTLRNILSQKRTTIFLRNYPPGDYYDLVYLPNLDNPESANNLLPQLLPFDEIPDGEVEKIRLFGLGARLDHFQLVWENGYIFIYRVV